MQHLASPAVARPSCQTLGRLLRIEPPPAVVAGHPRSGRRTDRGSPPRLTASLARLCAHQDSLQRRRELQAKCRVRAACASFVSSSSRIAKSFPSSHRGPNSMHAHSLVSFTPPSAESRAQSAVENRSRQVASLGAVGKEFVAFNTSALTRQSTGHPTAGHNGALRLGRAAVGCRLPLR